MQVKLDQILAWIDLPLEKRPQLITGLHMNGSFACLSLIEEYSVRAVSRPGWPQGWTHLQAR